MRSVWERWGILTDAMNMPNKPPMPKPMTPDMTLFAKQFSIAPVNLIPLELAI